jgi:SAM-dependent methyltransferase
MKKFNVYEDQERAESYSKLEFPGTYYLAYRDLPGLITEYTTGSRALDFGCGTGRSTRFLQRLGFDVTGIDISLGMIKKAREMDPRGKYIHLSARDFEYKACQPPLKDLVLSVFTFDNIPGLQTKQKILEGLRNLVKPEGVMINLVSQPHIYFHEWASFSTREFKENRLAQSGDKVKIIMKDVEDSRPVEDIICFHEDYQQIYELAGWKIIHTHDPLAADDEPYDWINETAISPWRIYVLG